MDILAEIVERKREELAERKARMPLEEVKQAAALVGQPRNFFKALTRPKQTVRLICEIKKASPSAGLIREDFDPVAIARAYEKAGAAAISVLTDEHYFQGSLDYLTEVKQAVNLPVLRKDFIVDPYQVWEARAAGADAVLLIAECLDEGQMLDLMILATELKMTVLLEVHDVESLLAVRPHIGFPLPQYCLLGINNRNLKTMTTDISHTLRMLDMVENPDILVTESGIHSRADIEKMTDAGVYRFLVGESLMKQEDIEGAVKALLS